MPRQKRAAPKTWSADWPSEPCSDPVAEVLREVALNLTVVAAGRSNREISRLTGVPHTVIGDVLSGESWVEAATIARLELGLDQAVWPRKV